jgi:hypothetical protein
MRLVMMMQGARCVWIPVHVPAPVDPVWAGESAHPIFPIVAPTGADGQAALQRIAKYMIHRIAKS